MRQNPIAIGCLQQQTSEEVRQSCEMAKSSAVPG